MSWRDQLAALPLGDACMICRSGKKKCDGARPVCGRCWRLDKPCHFSDKVTRRRRTDILQDKVVALQNRLLDVCNSHDRAILSAQLFEKMTLLTNPQHHTPAVKSSWLPLFPVALASQLAMGQVLSEDSAEGYRPVVPRASIEASFAQWDPATDVTPELAQYLIRIFLPFRSHFQFYMNIDTFMHAISLPSSDPRSIHPSLLNAVYLSACNLAQGALTDFEPTFLERTRYHLQLQLSLADRLLDFCWANVILGSYYGRLARLNEAYATISACARFAIACGLPGIEQPVTAGHPSPLLPPPADKKELEERIRLCHAIYMLDRCFAVCTGWPTAFGTIQDVTRFETVEDDESDSSYPKTSKESGASLLPEPSDLEVIGPDLTSGAQGSGPQQSSGVRGYVEILSDIKVRSMKVFESIELFARRTQDTGITPENSDEWSSLGCDLAALRPHIPPITDPSGIQPLEAVTKSNPHLIPAHTSFYGGSLILNSLVCAEDTLAQHRVLEAAAALAALAKQIRGSTVVSAIHTYVESIGHMLNAARIFARELRRADTRRDTRHLATCCNALADLIEFLHDLTAVHPKWAHVLGSLRALLPESPTLLETSPLS